MRRAVHHEFDRGFQPGAIGFVPPDDGRRHPVRIETTVAHELDDFGQEASRVGSGHVQRDALRVHLEQGDRVVLVKWVATLVHAP